MTKVSNNQRHDRMHSPYTIHTPVKTEFDTVVTQLTGVWSEPVDGFDETTGKEMVGYIRHLEDLGTHSTPVLASKAAEAWRAKGGGSSVTIDTVNA